MLKGYKREINIQVPTSIMEVNECSALAHRQLPRFDTVIMEHYLSDLTGLRDEVYGLFEKRPELLVAEQEGLTKGRHCLF